MKKGFTLIELLVVIAILAVLATAVVLAINPAELIRQARDSTRISDLAAINSAIALYLSDITSPGLGGPNGASCTNAARCTSGTTEFFSASIGSCGTNATTTVDGNGWVSVDLADISSGSPLSRLPLDPNNGQGSGDCAADGTTVCFYAFGCNGTNYEINAVMESTKFADDGGAAVEDTDGGDQLDIYEVGNNLAL